MNVASLQVERRAIRSEVGFRILSWQVLDDREGYRPLRLCVPSDAPLLSDLEKAFEWVGKYPKLAQKRVYVSFDLLSRDLFSRCVAEGLVRADRQCAFMPESCLLDDHDVSNVSPAERKVVLQNFKNRLRSIPEYDLDPEHPENRDVALLFALLFERGSDLEDLRRILSPGCEKAKEPDNREDHRAFEEDDPAAEATEEYDTENDETEEIVDEED